MDRRTFLRTSAVAVAGLAMPLRAVTARASTNVVTVPDTIAADGSRDVTAELLAFIAGVPDSSTIVFPAAGLYRVDGMLEVRSRSGFVIEGNGSTLLGGVPGPWAHLQFTSGEGHVVRNLSVRGANPNGGVESTRPQSNWQYQHAVSIRGVNGIALENVSVSDTYGDLFYLGDDTDEVPSQNVRLIGCTGMRSGRQGIALTATRTVLIEGCTLAEIRNTPLDFEPNARRNNTGVQVIGNTFGRRRSGFNWISAVGGTNNDILIMDNVVTDRDLKVECYAPKGFRNVGWRFENNVATNSWTTGKLMDFKRCDNVEVATTTNQCNPKQYATLVKVMECDSVMVHDNVVPDATKFLYQDAASTNCAEWNNVA